MVPKRFAQPNFWKITVASDKGLSDANIDLIVAMACEEARKTSKENMIILHDVIESKQYCQLLVETNKLGVTDLLSVLKDNFDYRIRASVLAL
ncbi:MAG: hypothetical protein AB1696_27720 [Planctomycetota bacterium]